jgi:hypothetical protein
MIVANFEVVCIVTQRRGTITDGCSVLGGCAMDNRITKTIVNHSNLHMPNPQLGAICRLRSIPNFKKTLDAKINTASTLLNR